MDPSPVLLSLHQAVLVEAWLLLEAVELLDHVTILLLMDATQEVLSANTNQAILITGTVLEQEAESILGNVQGL